MEKEKKSPIREHPDDPTLMWKCSWCYPDPDLFPPLPPGKRGWTDGICDFHLQLELEKIKRKKP